MARQNKTKYAILGCLNIRPMSAYEIKQFIQRSIAHFWTEREGQLYPALEKLYANGEVTFVEEPAQKKGFKKVYSITEKGQKNLLDWLKKTAEHPVYRNELLIKLFFGSMQSPENNIRLLQDAKLPLEETLQLLIALDASLNESVVPAERLPYIKICLDYGIQATRAELSWCDTAIDTLSQLKFDG